MVKPSMSIQYIVRKHSVVQGFQTSVVWTFWIFLNYSKTSRKHPALVADGIARGAWSPLVSLGVRSRVALYMLILVAFWSSMWPSSWYWIMTFATSRFVAFSHLLHCDPDNTAIALSYKSRPMKRDWSTNKLQAAEHLRVLKFAMFCFHFYIDFKRPNRWPQ